MAENKQTTEETKNKETENLQFTINLQNDYEIVLENTEGLWQAKLFGNGEVISNMILRNVEHTKIAIKHFEYYVRLLSYEDSIIGKKDNEEITNFLSSLSK